MSKITTVCVYTSCGVFSKCLNEHEFMCLMSLLSYRGMRAAPWVCVRGFNILILIQTHTERRYIVGYANEQIGLTFSACSSFFHLSNKEQWPISKPLKHILCSPVQLCLGCLLILRFACSRPLFFCFLSFLVPVDPPSLRSQPLRQTELNQTNL